MNTEPLGERGPYVVALQSAPSTKVTVPSLTATMTTPGW
jgi:hypothetical protein